ncbi:hypothetical protein GLOIN_2v1766467 [Rhizophagus irregularis DAOM 181602=DAOM 197198]|nr:hypothetical protein GLOIN_2v1766467 [Rhizophagus irregularis DAOM 181602=DAOM 197198]
MKLAEFQRVYNSTNDLEIQNNLLELEYQQKSRVKKARLLQEYQEVVLYDSPSYPPFLIQYPNLIEHIHKCIKFGVKDVDLNSKYNKYFFCTTLNNYLLPSQSNTKAAKTHYYLIIVANASVSCNERNKHIDEHYCFTSVKGAKQFVTLFSTNFTIISQDNNTKVSLVGMSSATHMSDFNFLTQDSRFDKILKVDSQIKLIWIILVDKGQVDDSEFAIRNFRYTGKALCTFWQHDPIFEKPVTVQYTDQNSSPFNDIIFSESEKEGTNELVIL